MNLTTNLKSKGMNKKHLQISINGINYIGLLGFATDKYCLIGCENKQKLNKIENILNVKCVTSRILATNLLGIFCVGNSNGIITTNTIYEYEKENLEKHFKVLILDSRYTAIGNLILMNDKGCIISKLLEKHVEEIAKFFKIPCEVYEGNDKLIGAIAVANNHGCIVGKEINTSQIERVLKVNVGFSTANFGSSYVGSCIITNSNGFVVGENTTGIELNQIKEILLRN
jgi:translation initiation factor 6